VAPPSDLTYSTNPATYTVGLAIAANGPSSGGGAVLSYSAPPAMPAGLSLDTSTGVITGTPTAVTPTAGYTVTATNSGGSASAAVRITVGVAPAVLSTSPPDGATGVALDAAVSAELSSALDPTSVNAASFGLSADGGLPLAGTVSAAGTRAVFVPASPLAPSTVYTATLAGVKDRAGSELAGAYSWSFTTAAAADATAPAIVSYSPGPNQAGVTVGALVAVQFSETLHPASASRASIASSAPRTRCSRLPRSHAHLRPDSSRRAAKTSVIHRRIASPSRSRSWTKGTSSGCVSRVSACLRPRASTADERRPT
jgi:hypothetical protein